MFQGASCLEFQHLSMSLMQSADSVSCVRITGKCTEIGNYCRWGTGILDVLEQGCTVLVQGYYKSQ